MGPARPSRRCVASHVPRSVCGSLTTCQWNDSTTYRFANSLRHQFLTHANDPNVAWYTLRSAALRLLPSVMLPRYVPCSRAWRCVSTFLSNRAKTLSVCVGSLWHGFHDAVRVSPSGPHRFSVALLVALPLG